MAHTLKRKRVGDSAQRKITKVSHEVEEQDADDMAPPSEPEEEGRMEQDSEEWGGISAPEPSSSSGKVVKPPTGDELRQIQAASSLFLSNAFKLQIDALLPSVAPKARHVTGVQQLVLSLHPVLMAIPTVQPTHPLEASRVLLKKSAIAVPYPLPLPTEETKWKVAFEKPSAINLVGSWANGMSVKKKDGLPFGVDIQVAMPESLFQEKDYLNSRYFHKRAFYLATLAAALTKAKITEITNMSYRSLADDPRLTVLVLDIQTFNVHVNIIPVLSEDSPIPLTRLGATQANLRGVADNSTPNYNAALLQTVSPVGIAQITAAHELKKNVPAFTEAQSLLRVWANQRGYTQAHGTNICIAGFDALGPWWSRILDLVINGEQPAAEPKARKTQRKPVGRGLSSYQLFRAALDFLARHDFVAAPVFLKDAVATHELGHGPAFVTGHVNVLQGVPLGSLKLLRLDAQRTLDALNTIPDPFHEVFLQDQRSLATRFDAVLHIDLSSARLPSTPEQSHRVADIGSAPTALLHAISERLQQALESRVKAVVILMPSPGLRPLSQAHPSSAQHIVLGLLYDPTAAFRQVESGPAVNSESSATPSEESIAFRTLWGPKAEVRRFSDGRITESVVWDVKTVDEKAHIPVRIVKFILGHHFDINVDDDGGQVGAWQAPFDAVLRLPESHGKLYTHHASSIAGGIGVKAASSAFDNLVKQIKQLESLPLSLLNISPTSSILRYTSPFTPVPLTPGLARVLPPNARWLPTIEFVLAFEKSGKWPDELKAIQKIKLAFFERIAVGLMESVSGLKAAVVVGDDLSTQAAMEDQSYLQITTKEGWAFNARIWHDREATLLDRILLNKAGNLPHIMPNRKDAHRDGEYYQAVRAKEVYLRRFLHAPRHHRAIAKLSHSFPAYAGTARLVKRWFAAHWILGGHICDEVVELICAAAFVWDGWEADMDTETDRTTPPRAGVPGSKERGFAKVIEWLKDWDWTLGCSIPLYAALDEAAPDPLPNVPGHYKGVWKVSTAMDSSGLTWTRNGPDAVVARRISHLAKGAWECLQGMQEGRFDVKAVFTHPTNDYSHIIKLNPTALPRYFQGINIDLSQLAPSQRGKYANSAPEEEDSILVRPGFDPAYLLFKDLQRVYADTCLLFFDCFGGHQIGIVWDPALLNPSPFKVLGGYSMTPVDGPSKEKEKSKDKVLVKLNSAAIIGEMARMGNGIVL